MRHKHRHVDSKKTFLKMLGVLEKAGAIGFDLETHGTDWYRGADIAGLGFGVIEDSRIRTFYVPVNHIDLEGLPREGNLSETYVLERLAPLFASDVPKIGANIKFDAHFIERRGLEINNLDDVQAMARLHRSDFLKVALDTLIKAEFQSEHVGEKALKDWWRKNKVRYSGDKGDSVRYAKAPSEVTGAYCGEDVYWTLRLAIRYARMFEEDPKSKRVYLTIEKPLIRVTMDMERRGAYIDRRYIKSLCRPLDKAVAKSQNRCYRLAKVEWDIDSPQQTKKVLLKTGVKTEDRRRKRKDGTVEFTPSLDKTVLEKYKDSNKLVKNVLLYRRFRHHKSSFVDNILVAAARLKKGRGHIHTQLRQESAMTGRFGCSSPNLMALPKDKDDTDPIEKFSIRKAFVPKDEFSVLLAIDYVNMEYRMAAAFSGDRELIRMFKENLDLHSHTACLVYGVKEPTKKQRSVAKIYNFSDMYGAGAESMAAKLQLPIDEIREFKLMHQRTFPQLHRWKRYVYNRCLRDGGVRNVFGRFRILSSQRAYTAVNTLIQGTCADVLKTALLRIAKFLRGMRSYLVFPVHDEVVINYDVRDGDLILPTRAGPGIVKLMETFTAGGKPLFRVPLLTEVSVCRVNWAEKETMDLADLAIRFLPHKELGKPYPVSEVVNGTAHVVPAM